MHQIEIRTPGELTAAEREAWQAMCAAERAFRSPLLGPAFAELVGRVRSDVAIALVRRGGRPVAFFPHHRRPGGVARPIGAPFSDIHAVVSEPDAGFDAATLLSGAGLRRFPFTGLNDPFGLFSSDYRSAEPSLLIELGDPFAPKLAALAARERKHMKKVRRWLNRINTEVGAVEFRAPDPDPVALDQLIAWKRRQLSRTGLHDFLGPDWTRALMAAAHRRQEGDCRGLLCTLRVEGRMIAGRLGVRTGGVLRTWLAAYDPAFAAYGPGHLLMWDLIQDLARLELQTYELGVGMPDLKGVWATDSETLHAGEASSGARAALRLTRGPLDRLRRRLDQIAVVELDFPGRARGVLHALASAPRRWRAA